MKWLGLVALLIAAESTPDGGQVQIDVEELNEWQIVVDAGTSSMPKEHRYRIIIIPTPSNHDCQNSPFSDCPI